MNNFLRTRSSASAAARLLARACVVGAWLAWGATAGAAGYSAVELGSLGGCCGHAFGVNARGQVAGLSYPSGDSSAHAFVTGPDGMGSSDLGTFGGAWSIAYGINDHGQVTGAYGRPDGAIRGFVTGPDATGMTELGTLHGTVNSMAMAVNNSGLTVGSSWSYGGAYHGFIADADGSNMTDLGLNLAPTAINATGQVAGYSFSPDGNQAFVTDAGGGGLRYLGTLEGDSWARASGINSAGQVVGISFGGDYGHAFITGPGGLGMTVLGNLSGANYSEAYAINFSGQVVGEFWNGGDYLHAFVTGANGIGLVDVNSLVVLPDGEFFTQALAINDSGQFVTRSSHGRLFLISPVPEPATLALMLGGLAGVGWAVRRHPMARH